MRKINFNLTINNFTLLTNTFFMKLTLTLLLFCFGLVTVAQTEINDDNIEAKLFRDDSTPVVVDFYATWCGPCKRMDPILAELVDRYDGKVIFYKMDVDKNEADDVLGIESIPTYLFVQDGELTHMAEGAMPKSDFITLIEESFTMASSSSSYASGGSYSGGQPDDSEYSDAKINAIWNDSGELNELAWHAYEEHDDIAALLISIDLVKRSIQLDENSYNTDTYAALLFKTGKYTDALKQAKRSIELAKSDGRDYSSTTQLINQIIEKL